MTYGDLVAADLDVLYIATPHPQHHDLALAAIRNGTPVLVEKSFTATLDGAREVVAAARGARVFCMEAMWTRLQPAVLEARGSWRPARSARSPRVQADFGAHRAYDPTHRLFAPELGGGAILDLGVYLISIAQHFLGTPTGVTAAGTLYPNGTDASVSCTCRTTTGAGPASPPPCRRRPLPGRGGRAPAAPSRSRRRSTTRRDSWYGAQGAEAESSTSPALGRGYAHEIDEVNRCLAAGLTECPLMPLQDTLGVQWVMEETLAQLGVATTEGVVDLTASSVGDAAAHRLGLAALLLASQPPLLRAARRPGRPARRRWRRQRLAQQVGQPLAGGDPVAVLRAVLGGGDRDPAVRASVAAPASAGRR